MTKTRMWLIQSIALLVVGIVLLTFVQAVYVPKITAYTNAIVTGSVPSMEMFGLDVTTLLISTVLSIVGAILVLLGAVLLVILFVLKVIMSHTIKISVNI